MGSQNNQSGLGSAMTSGDSGVGSNTGYSWQDNPNGPAFTMPDGSPPPSTDPGNLAGLTGIQSGATMPNFSNAVSPSGNYSFNMPNASNNWAQNAQNALSGGAKALQGANGTGTGQSGASKAAGGGRVTLPSKSFGAPVISTPVVAGSQGAGGQGLLQLLSKYRAGTT